jgi:hypothetical protein
MNGGNNTTAASNPITLRIKKPAIRKIAPMNNLKNRKIANEKPCKLSSPG